MFVFLLPALLVVATVHAALIASDLPRENRWPNRAGGSLDR